MQIKSMDWFLYDIDLLHERVNQTELRYKYFYHIFFFFIPWLKSLTWDKVFKSGLSKFCGRQPLKNLLSPLVNTLSHLFRVTNNFLR